jgi:N-acetylmuramoyl-L-alanine amidase
MDLMYWLTIKNTNSRSFKRFLAVVLFSIIGLIIQPSDCFSKNAVQPTIVIDPGHGGNDTGAKGPDGTLEKNVSMTLANLIVESLANKYRTVLTRNDDYGLGIMERTSIANTEKASLFVSIHTGGSYKYKISGIMVFFFKNFSDTLQKSEKVGSFDLDDQEMQVPWDEIQQKHVASSMEAAETIHNRLSKNTQFSQSQVFGAPLLVLTGADMPSVLLEIGYLTDPAEEKKLNNNRYLSYFAQEISKGIDDFFQKSEKPYN